MIHIAFFYFTHSSFFSKPADYITQNLSLPENTEGNLSEYMGLHPEPQKLYTSFFRPVKTQCVILVEVPLKEPRGGIMIMRIWFKFFQLLTFLHQDSLSKETQQNNNKDFFPPPMEWGSHSCFSLILIYLLLKDMMKFHGKDWRVVQSTEESPLCVNAH